MTSGFFWRAILPKGSRITLRPASREVILPPALRVTHPPALRIDFGVNHTQPPTRR
jgi:hypothetical protein